MEIISSTFVLLTSTVLINFPSLNAVTISAISKTSSKRCETYIMPTPWDFNFLKILKSFSSSKVVSEEDGSSMIIILGSKAKARATAIICCSPMLRSDNLALGSTLISKSFNNSLLLLRISFFLSSRCTLSGSLARNRYCAIVKVGTICNS